MLFILFITATAQNPSDSLAIENACRNYIEGWHQGNMEKISTSVSPELVKRTVMADGEGKSFTTGMS